MSDTPILQPGDIIHILVDSHATAERISDIEKMYESWGIKIGGITVFPMSGMRIASIVRIPGPKTPMDLMMAMRPPGAR